jgi:hypothetical protein
VSGTVTVVLSSVDGVHLAMTPLIQQVTDAMNQVAGAAHPPLGSFQDGVSTATDHDMLKDDFVRRLQQLVWDLMAARDGTATVTPSYAAIERDNVGVIGGAAATDASGSQVA